MQTKIEITVENDSIHCSFDGNSYEIIDGLIIALARRISSGRQPGVTNEALAEAIRKSVLEALEMDTEKGW